VNHEFKSYTERLQGCIASQSKRSASSPEGADQEFNELALHLFRLQFQHNTPYARFCTNRRRTPENVAEWSQIPAMPTAGFKEFELTCLPPNARTRVFHSSGTTAQTPSRHFHNTESLALYEASSLSWFTQHLCPTPQDGLQAISLTPPATETPHSSLVHMLEIIARHLPQFAFTGTVLPDGSWAVDFPKTIALLTNAVAEQSPVLLLGTAFSFVHLLDHLNSQHKEFILPPDSRVMETGGYKGRSRTLPRTELHRNITDSLGVPHRAIVSEYGMSELSSQAYNRVAGTEPPTDPSAPDAIPFHFPPWARSTVVSPENGQEVAEGETGLVQVLDLANVASVLAVRTEDLAVRQGRHFQLQGRAAEAEPRGCSLMSG